MLDAEDLQRGGEQSGHSVEEPEAVAAHTVGPGQRLVPPVQAEPLAPEAADVVQVGPGVEAQEPDVAVRAEDELPQPGALVEGGGGRGGCCQREREATAGQRGKPRRR